MGNCYSIKTDKKSKRYYRKFRLHRPENEGPAVEWECGSKEWWYNGQLHRENGPAIDMADGYKEWWYNGQLHRDNGPAVIGYHNHKEWWLYGQYINDKPTIEKINANTYENEYFIVPVERDYAYQEPSAPPWKNIEELTLYPYLRDLNDCEYQEPSEPPWEINYEYQKPFELPLEINYKYQEPFEPPLEIE